MACSKYIATPEKTRAARVSRLVVDPCTDLFRDILREHVTEIQFPGKLHEKKSKLSPVLNKVQRDLLYPNTGSFLGTYEEFDLSLLYVLLRNITTIPPHRKGWAKTPHPSDRSLSANIDRIREVRNTYCGHAANLSMPELKFNALWHELTGIIGDLESSLPGGCTTYTDAANQIKTDAMDPEMEKKYLDQIDEQHRSIEDLKGKVGRVEERTEETDKKVEALDGKVERVEEQMKETDKKVEALDGKVAKLTESPIPPNVRDQHDIDIQKWREEDKLYYETHSFSSVMETVRSQPCMTLVGGSGSGKSATAHHIALKLQEEGYEIVPVDEIREIKQYCDTKNPQVFVIDDVVGVFGLQKTKLDVLTDYEQKITKPCMVKSRTLMTCREAVFNETLPYKPFLTKEETVIRLNSSDHELDDNDKKQILQKYGLNEDLMSPALLKLTSRMFPLLCKLYSKETKFQALGYKFFLNPVQCIIDELDEMQRYNKLNYATLVLCMLNENSLAKDILKDRKNDHFMNMKIDTLENCELESQTDAFKFVKALSAMEGTYTKQSGAQYTFIHDSMFEICAYHYGQQFPDQMLLYMSSSYIANSVKPQTSEPGIAPKVKERQSDSQSSKGDKSSNDSDRKMESDDKSNEREESFDLCIRLREDQYPLLAERLYRDIQNMELYDVFRNPVLKHPQVCQAFIGMLETKSYTELKSLFLSSHGEVDKIGRKRKHAREEREKMDVLVDQRYKRNDKGERIGYTYNVRVISWVIYFGHYQIIEYIIQQMEQHNEISELFEITGNSPHQSKSGIYTHNKQESENNRLVEQRRLLTLSCYSGDVQTVRVLLPVCKKAINGLGLISRDIYCTDTPLTAACEGGHVDILKELVKAGADVNLQDNDRNTPLVVACKGGHVDIVRELVKARADVNLQDNDRNTPLVVACKGGHVDIVRELVKARADVNLQDNDRNTPLVVACKGGHVDIVKELVKAWADVNLQDNDRNTPLVVACKGGHVDIVRELVKARADVNLQDNDRNTPLVDACKGGHVSVVEELVKAGADVNLQDRLGNTPLITACEGGHVSVVKELVKAGADVNLQDRLENTPLIAACEGGHVSVVEELVKAGADVNLQDNDRNTPLVVACKGGHVSVVEELVKAGADVNLQDRLGNTPPIAACEGGHVSVVEELVKAGADVNLQDRLENTPLITACEGGHVSVVEELVKAGADVNLQDRRGNTPLIVAKEKGHVSVVKELVKAGADVNLQEEVDKIQNKRECVEEESLVYEDPMVMCLLLCPTYKLEINDQKWIPKYNAVAEKFGFTTITKQTDLLQPEKYKPVLNFSESEITFSTDVWRDRSFLKATESHDFVDIFLNWGEKENIVNYCRSPSHRKDKGEVCYCLEANQIEKFVERLGEDIFTHSAIQDLSVKKFAYRKEKENILRDFHAWLKDSYENIRVMRLYIGKSDCSQYTFTARQEVIVLVIDGFNPIEENTYQHRKNTFPIICKLWKFLPKNDVSTIADVEPLSSSTMLSKVEKQIQNISKSLFQIHSNLEIVSASDYRLKDIGEEKKHEICIVLYCSCKGVVPLHEPKFPKEIEGTKTDVREGFFHLFGNGNLFKRSTDLLNPLMMGASIGKKDDNNGGTLGGFVTLNNGEIGFITCAHVLVDLSSQCDPSAQFDVVQPSYGFMHTNEVCGTHERSCFPSRSNTSNCTIDAALVKLTNRFPERGLFAELTADSLKENGYSIENLPEYSTGDVRDCEEAARRMLPCVKWGAKTGFTRGMLRLEGTAVRWTTDPINLGNPPSQVSYIYNKQLEIQGIGGMSFALPGDSGALVFQIDPAKEKGEEHQLHCIGMIVGGTSAGKTIVTPIKPILEALKVKMHKFSLNTMDES